MLNKINIKIEKLENADKASPPINSPPLEVDENIVM